MYTVTKHNAITLFQLITLNYASQVHHHQWSHRTTSKQTDFILNNIKSSMLTVHLSYIHTYMFFKSLQSFQMLSYYRLVQIKVYFLFLFFVIPCCSHTLLLFRFHFNLFWTVFISVRRYTNDTWPRHMKQF